MELKVFRNPKKQAQFKKMMWNDRIEWAAAETGLSEKTVREYMKVFVEHNILDEYGNMTPRAREIATPFFKE